MPQSTDPNAPDYVNPTFTSGPAPGQPGSQSNPWGQPGGPADPASNITGYTADGIPIYASQNDPTHLSTGNWRGGIANDVGRYRGMGASGAAPTPQIAQPDQARGLSNDAVGMLGARAGGAETPQDILARQMTQGAVNGIQSGAASIRGGAGARAAAARGAVATGARVNAQGMQDQQALHARGMADAAGQYFGAATAQRGEEVGLATSQAQLEAQQRAQAEQRGEFYEGMGQDTKNSALGASQGQTAAATSAAAADRRAALAEGSQGWENTKDLIGGATGGAAGAAAAYNKTQGGGSNGAGTGDPNDPNNPNYSGSDPRMKRDIHPITDAQAARLKHSGEMMLGQQRAGLEGGASVGRHPAEPPAYDGKYLGTADRYAPPDVISGAGKTPPHRGLLDVIGERVAADKASEPRYGYFDEDEGNSRPRLSAAPQGYAASRAGQPGAMFGGPPQVARDPYAGQAPGTEDFERGAHHLMSKGDRDIAMSDPRAKEAAYIAGHAEGAAQEVARASSAHGAEMKAARDPETASMLKDGGVPSTGPIGAAMGRAYGAGEEHFGVASPVYAYDKHLGSGATAYTPGPKIAHEPAPSGDFASQVEGHFGAPKAHDSPMAAANRSMAPSSYQYKPEFTPPEQQPGETNVGPMANKMEANPVAKTAIVKDPNTGLLAIDKTKGLKLVMGGLSSLQTQVDRMQGGRR
jgi:hypothetical protein